MCGRMTQATDPAEVARIFDADSRVDAEDEWAAPRYNVAPTQPLTVVLERATEGRVVEQHRWGLIPSFAKSAKDGAKRINARAETIASSPSFRTSFSKRRCIVPADGFYEWRRTGGRKQPFYLHPPEDAVLAMAGLWSVWKDPATGLWVPSAAVVTTDANRLVSTPSRPHAGAAAPGGLGRLARPGGGRPGVPALPARAGPGRRPLDGTRSRPRSTTSATRDRSS